MEVNNVGISREQTTHKVRNEEADQTLVEGINHVHPEHVWLVFLRENNNHTIVNWIPDRWDFHFSVFKRLMFLPQIHHLHDSCQKVF